MELKGGEVVLAPFRYAETEGRKLRPALVWEVTPVAVLLVYISSQHVCHDGGYQTEVGLDHREAEAIGLIKPSRIDFGKTDVCLPGDIRKVLGHIQKLPRRKLWECKEAAKKAGLLRF